MNIKPCGPNPNEFVFVRLQKPKVVEANYRVAPCFQNQFAASLPR